MPPKRDYGPPTRSSSRIASQSRDGDDIKNEDSGRQSPRASEPENQPTTTEPEEPVTTIESDSYDSAPEQPEVRKNNAATPVQSIEDEPPTPTNTRTPKTIMSAPSATSDQGVTSTEQTLSAILARLTQIEAAQTPTTLDRSQRGITPADSANGPTFKPSGFSAMDQFRPYGSDQNAKNPVYNEKRRETHLNPGKFDGNKDLFDIWIIDLADKCRRDDRTFEVERDRMMLINSYLEEKPKQLLSARFGSTEIPFSSAAEMIATLCGVYHDDNQASKARQELSTLMYNPSDKSTDIHQYIGRVNSLADKANISRDDRKMILEEHIPATLGTDLLTKSKDPACSYEAFCSFVADAAVTQQRAYNERRDKKLARRDASPPTRTNPRRQLPPFVKKEVRHEETLRPAFKPADRVRSDQPKETRACFICHKEGHLARDCSDRKDIARLLKELEDQDTSDQDGSARPGSPDQSNPGTDSDSENY